MTEDLQYDIDAIERTARLHSGALEISFLQNGMCIADLTISPDDSGALCLSGNGHDLISALVDLAMHPNIVRGPGGR